MTSFHILITFLLALHFSLTAQAREQKLPDSIRPYFLPEKTNFVSLEQSVEADLNYEEKKLQSSNHQQQFSFSHLKHSHLNNSTYLIWKFVPVGVGHRFKQSNSEQVSAEWEMKYLPDETLLLSPHFSGKRKAFWNSRFGDEYVLSYGYHYFPNPKPSYWDINLKYNLIYLPTEKWRLGTFFQPEKFFKGLFSVAKAPNPFPYESTLTFGVWSELDVTRNLLFSLQGTIHFLEEHLDTFKAKYSAHSSLGMYF